MPSGHPFFQRKSLAGPSSPFSLFSFVPKLSPPLSYQTCTHFRNVSLEVLPWSPLPSAPPPAGPGEGLFLELPPPLPPHTTVCWSNNPNAKNSLTIVANYYQDTGTGRRRVWSPQDPDVWRCASHSPLTHTECQPPAATSAMGRPCSASNSLGSSSASRVPWPSCPCLSKGTPSQLQSHQGVSLPFLQQSHSPTLTCSPPTPA